MANGRYKVEYTASALEDLRSLPKREADQILRKVLRLEHGLHGNIKRLQNADAAFRLRMGDYRVLFDVTTVRFRNPVNTGDLRGQLIGMGLAVGQVPVKWAFSQRG
jgi:mRNA interferase RelE/StbE